MVYSLLNATKVGVFKTLRAGYIYLPSFQVSPEVEITFSTDGTLDYSGDLQTDYCGSNFYNLRCAC